MDECFEAPAEEMKLVRLQTLEKVELQKSTLLKNCVKSGFIYKRGKTIKTWIKYLGVLSGGYLYLYSNAKDLKAAECIWVKNSVITPVEENQVGFANAFSVKNKYTNVFFASDKANVAQQWIEEISKIKTEPPKQMISDKDLEEFGGNEGEKQVRSQMSSQQLINLDLVQIEAHFEIGNIQLSLFDNRNHLKSPFITLQTKKLAVDYVERKQQMDVNLVLGGLFLSDFLYKYKDQSLKDFITSESQDKQINNDLIQVGLIILEKGHPNYKNVDFDIDLKLNNLILNYKSDTLAKMLLFLQPDTPDFLRNETEMDFSANLNRISSIFAAEQSVPSLDEGALSSQQSENNNIIQDNQTILISAKVQINQIKIVMVNRKNKLPINDILIQNINLKFEQKSDEMYITSSLGNLQVRDLTNFPNTIYLEEDYHKAVPLELLGNSIKDGQQSLLDLEIRLLSEGSNKIKEDNVDIFVKLNFNSIHLNYMQAPVMRFIDFILEQLLNTLDTPEFFIDESELIEKNKISFNKALNQAKDPIQSLDKIGKNKIMQTLQNPLLLSLDILIQNPLITLTPNPQSKEYLQADLGTIKVTNQVIKNENRLLDCNLKNELKETYSSLYNVNASNMQIRIIKGSEVNQITNQFDLNVSVDLCGYFFEYKYIYGSDIKLDSTLTVKNHISPIIFRVSNNDYNLIMKCIFHNIAYDDGCDRFFIHEWERYQKVQAVIEKKIKKEEEQKMKKINGVDSYLDRDGIKVQVDLESLSVFALDKKTKLPFARVTLGRMRVIQNIDANIETTQVESLSTFVYAQTLNASYFDEMNGIFKESSLLGQVRDDSIYTVEEIQDFEILVSKSIFTDERQAKEVINKNIYEFVQYEDLVKAKTNNKFQIVFELLMHDNDDKDIDIILSECKVQAQVKSILSIADFVELDPSTDSPEPVFKVELTKQQIKMQEEAAKEIKSIDKQKRMGALTNINIQVKKIVLCTSCLDGTNVLTLRGAVGVNLTLQDIQTKQLQMQIKNEIKQQKNYHPNINTTSIIKVNVQNLEVFICKSSELKQDDFNKVLKRSILLPLNLNFKKTDYLIPTAENKNIFNNQSNIEANLEKTVLKITFLDLTLIYKAVLSILEDIKNIPDKPKNSDQLIVEMEEEVQLPRTTQLDFSKLNKSQIFTKITEVEKIKQELEQKETMLMQIVQHETQINLIDAFVDISGLEVIVINDMNKTYVPVLDFNIYDLNIKMKENNISMNVATMFELGAEYYNPRVGLWEPIIERVGLNVDFVKSNVSHTKQLLTIEMNPNYNTFNVILSTQFISVISKTTQTVTREIIPAVRKTKDSVIQNIRNVNQIFETEEQKYEETGSDEDDNLQNISPYTVRNETGYPIIVSTDLSNDSLLNKKEQKPYSCRLNNFEEKNFVVDMMEQKLANDKNETYVFKQYSEQVKVKLEVPGTPLKDIERIDLDKLRNRLRVCKTLYNQKQFEVITEVKLDPISFKKILNISSPFTFFNKCNTQVSFCLYDTRGIFKKEFSIKKNERFPIPIDLLNGSFSVKYEGDNSDIYNFRQFSSNTQNNKVVEIKFQDAFFLLKMQADPENDKRIIFQLEPPYRIKNCLPKSLLVQLVNFNKSDNQVAKRKRLTDSSQNIASGSVEEFYKCSIQLDSVIVLQIPGTFPSNEIKITNEEIGQVILKDANGNQSEISVHRKESKTDGCRELLIYCSGYLINESAYKLNLHSSSNKSKTVGGQSQIYENESLNTNFILFGSETGDKLSISEQQYQKISKPAIIGGVGTTQIDLQYLDERQQPAFQTMGINVSIKNVDFDSKLFSKIITISPRFILVNKTGFQVQVKQRGFDYKVLNIQKDSRIPLSWNDENSKRLLNLRITEQGKDWNWSGNLNIQELGTVNFMIRNNSTGGIETAFLRTDIRSDDSNIFIVIEKVSDNERPYLVQNLSSKITLTVGKDVVLLPQSEESCSVDQNQQYYFAWENPFEQEKKVSVSIHPVDHSFQSYNFSFSPDQIYMANKIQILPIGHRDLKKNKDSSIFIKWQIMITGYTKIINFEDCDADEPVTEQEKIELRERLEKEQEQRHIQPNQAPQSLQSSQKEMTMKKQEEMKQSQVPLVKSIIEQQINVCIKEFGISVVQNHRMNEKPKELINITLKGVEFVTVEKTESKTSQLRIKLLNIDQNNSYTLQEPVILTPSRYSLYKNDISQPPYFINVLVEQNLLATNITLLNNLVVEVNPFTVRIEEQFINTIMDFIQSLEEARYIPEGSHLHTIITQIDQSQSKLKNQNKNKYFKWQECEIPPSSIPTFINQLILSNVEVNLSFKAKMKAGEQGNMVFITELFSALGVVISDMDAPIRLNGIRLVNCLETVPGILSKLGSHYKNQAVTELLKSFGSLNIIGNPVGLFYNISTGFQDLIQKPVEGFAKGPLDVGLGIMQGASSLIKNTMVGTFNSVNKITGSLSSGVSALCMDEEYLLEREKMRQKKPQSIVDGAVQGMTSIFSGVANGISGVFLNPIEGAKKGGAFGLFKGIGKGLAGLIAKPVSGVLDAASSVAGGIKNSINLGDDKANDIRFRNPRVFYGREGFYKEFISLDAGIKSTLQTTASGKYANVDFLQTYQILGENKNENKNTVLLISYDVVILYEEAKKKRQWSFETEEFVNVEMKANGILFFTSKPIEKIKTNNTFIVIDKQEQREYIYQQLKTLKLQLDQEKSVKMLDS